MRSWRLAVIVWGATLATSDGADRYFAQFSDGSVTSALEIADWNDPAAEPKIDGRALFARENPVRSLFAVQAPVPELPEAYVELIGGDLLAGHATKLLLQSTDPYDEAPPHVLVSPLFEVKTPHPEAGGEPPQLRVVWDQVRRIVWRRNAGEELPPGCLRLANGGRIPFRSVRWKETSISLLTADGVREVKRDDAAEIHLPSADPWASYFQQLAILSPGLSARLVQTETSSGCRLTASVDRMRSTHHGDRNRPENWIHTVQPAWSLDPIGLAHRSVVRLATFTPLEPPLSRFVPASVSRKPVLGAAWNWRTDRNVSGQWLRTAKRPFAWGFGVHGSTELEFAAPAFVRAVRAQFAVDAAAGSGGCVTAEIRVNDQPSNFRHEFLRGGREPVDSGWIPFPTGDREHRLTLSVDMAHAGRPGDADPLDVRDLADWLEPQLQLDADAVRSRVDALRSIAIPALSSWTAGARADRIEMAHVADEKSRQFDVRFRTRIEKVDRFAAWSRRLRFGPRDAWLNLAISRFQDSPAKPRLLVRIEGKPVGEFELPMRNNWVDPDPVSVPLGAWRGKTATVDVVLMGDDGPLEVDWRGVSTSEHLPGLLPVFDDDASLASVLEPAGAAEFAREKPYAGEGCLRIRSAEQARIPGLSANIVELPQLGDFRYVVFAWRKAAGQRLELQWAEDGAFHSHDLDAATRQRLRQREPRSRRLGPTERGFEFRYTYSAETGKQRPGEHRLADRLPTEWQWQTRDLYGDFGPFLLTGFALRNRGGESAELDAVYLARSWSDIERIRQRLERERNPPQPRPEIASEATDADHFAAPLRAFAPDFATAGAGHLVHWRKRGDETDVLQTHPAAQDRSLRMHALVAPPAGRPWFLVMDVKNHENFDFRLVVRCNGEVLYDQVVGDDLTKKQFMPLRVDLSRFAGQTVLVEIEHAGNNWANEYAHWKSIRFESTAP